MRTRPVRPPLLAVAALLAAAATAGVIAAIDDGDRPEVAEVATTDPSTTTSSTTSSTTTTSTSTTTTSTSTTTTAPPPPPTTPPATSPPATTPPPPPPPPPPSNPRITTVTAADLGASWHVGCPVSPQSLRRISVTHRGFDGRDHTGVLIVHADWADELLGVFDQIHRAGFAIERIEPVSNYGASDDASMAANNTSAFNCREVTGGGGWSRHSYGRAIDINPIQNPYVIDRAAPATDTILPTAGGPYAFDRSPRQGVITAGDAVVSAFASLGWQWGGNWTSPIDYQHFDIR